MANNNEAAVAVKLTRLEQYVLDHPNTVIGELAEQLGTTCSAVTKAYSRAKAKVEAAESESRYNLGQLRKKETFLVEHLTKVREQIAVTEKPYKGKSWLQWTPADVADAIADGVYRHGPFPGFQPLNQVPNPLIG